eukprot:TRINITY_DN7509_c0_g2_i1.p1 TRINITY_DN7509_c0_g2~~TRINITY_DN7509_c0_g2_i1.p1  ORF type:complete len:167 (+),score=40.19 TRINITY_DN7509_c0_g2_i1:139-639(+)
MEAAGALNTLKVKEVLETIANNVDFYDQRRELNFTFREKLISLQSIFSKLKNGIFLPDELQQTLEHFEDYDGLVDQLDSIEGLNAVLKEIDKMNEGAIYGIPDLKRKIAKQVEKLNIMFGFKKVETVDSTRRETFVPREAPKAAELDEENVPYKLMAIKFNSGPSK